MTSGIAGKRQLIPIAMGIEILEGVSNAAKIIKGFGGIFFKYTKQIVVIYVYLGSRLEEFIIVKMIGVVVLAPIEGDYAVSL